MPPFTCRRLPHTRSTGEPVFLTWRLHGSLPANRHFPPNLTSGQAFAALDHLLDTAITGPLHLSRPEIATTIIDAIHFQQRELAHYQAHAWVIMANHVHLLITPNKPLAAITQTLKRHTPANPSGKTKPSTEPSEPPPNSARSPTTSTKTQSKPAWSPPTTTYDQIPNPVWGRFLTCGGFSIRLAPTHNKTSKKLFSPRINHLPPLQHPTPNARNLP